MSFRVLCSHGIHVLAKLVFRGPPANATQRERAMKPIDSVAPGTNCNYIRLNRKYAPNSTGANAGRKGCISRLASVWCMVFCACVCLCGFPFISFAGM